MADAKDPSTKDLLLLITGFEVPKTPPATAGSGAVYWLKDGTDELRESKFNDKWLSSPGAAWDAVRFRDWLIATLFGSICKYKHDFVAISEPLLASIDVLNKEFTREMKGISPSITKALNTKDGRPRSLFNTLSLGISHHVKDGKEVFMAGAGMRRRARFWKTESLAIQADVEFFVPFYELPNNEPTPQPNHFYSINAGIALSHSDGSPLKTEAETNKELMAVRFNLRVPFGGQWKAGKEQEEFETVFDDPEINIEKRVRDNRQAPVSAWQDFDKWEEFVEAFCEDADGTELLNVPIGPLLLEKVADEASVKDIILKQKKRDQIKRELAESQKEFKETMKLLENIWSIKPPPEKDGAGPNAGQRKLGHLLESLGFMTSKGGAEAEYKFKITKDLTVWDVVNRIFAELDGYPLWVKGATPKKDKEARIAVSLASQTSETDPNKSYFGLAGLIYNIGLKTVPPDKPAKTEKDKDDDNGAWIVVSKDNFNKDESIFIEDDDEEEEDGEEQPKPDKPKEEQKSTVEVYLHLGKWFSDETLDDNWYQRLLPPAESPQKRRVPIPGIRILPVQRVATLPKTGNQEAVFSWTFRADLLSLGIDIKSVTKNGLGFLQGMAGHFGLGAVEVRLAVSVFGGSNKEWWERVQIGVGVKLKDLRLSLGPKEEEDKKKDSGNEIMDGIENILSDEWLEELAPEKSKSPKVKTRLSAKKKDKFSISVGYLTQLTKDSKGTLDVQLYDEKGNRGKMALIPIDRSKGPIYIRRIGIGLKGVENIELNKGLPDGAQLTVTLTGGIRLPVFELGFINAKLIFQLNNPAALKFGLEGLDVSVKIGSVVVSGSFFKTGIEYAGMLTVDMPKASFSAMGFYGSLRMFYISRDDTVVADLNNGKIHKKLKDKLDAEKITPASSTPIKKGSGTDEWVLYTNDNRHFTITDDDEKLNLLRSEKTFFVYAVLNAASGCGPTFGPIQFTGIALGYGYNRRLIVPRIEDVAEFPMVQMVMGEGGYQEDGTDTRSQLGKPLEDPVSMLEKFKDHVVAEAGQQFACGGVRFTVGGVIDCFALMVVQWSENDIELTMLGLARFRHPRDLKADAICYVELQIRMSLKPSEGTFQLQALLTDNSWIINENCKLTGGFALFIWFGGVHKGDWVITFGGYHPRFVRPAHYPIVPRLGLNWPVNGNLTIKGGIYLAITPSCGMLGARMEATFHSGRISAWFTAYLDVVVNWQPLYFEAELGISLRVEADLWLTSLKVTIGVNIQLWGPPIGGIVHVDLTVISFDIDFGTPKPAQPELVKSWQDFCRNFLNLTGTDRPAVNDPVQAFQIVQPNLTGGRQNLNTIPNKSRAEQDTKRDDDLWKVRADELELAAATVVPVTTLNVGTVKTNSPPEGVQKKEFTGRPVMVTKPLAIEKKGLLRGNANQPPKLSVYPMGKALESTLNVTIVSDELSAPDKVDLSEWTMEEETSALPAALWDSAKPNLRPTEPSAKMIPGGITGLKKLKPPRGKLGNKAVPPAIEWHVLGPGSVSRSSETQEIPTAKSGRDLRPAMVEKHVNQKDVAAALKAAGFALTWQAPDPANLRFRELQAEPLAGVVAA